MIFESSMQLWITHNGEREKLRFPVLPTKFDVTHGTKNTSVTISGLGEILVLQDRAAVEVSWDSFFPAAYFPGIQTPFMLSSPDAMIQRLFEWKISAKPVHLILTGTRVNFYAAIQSLQSYRKGGDPGSIYYKIKLKEYREVRIRQVKVSSTGTATVSGGSTRTDNRVQAKTYTVKPGDCLYNISKSTLGDGGRYNEIYCLNKDKLKNPNLIYPGQVLRIATQFPVASKWYIVRQGDTLSSIADRYNTTVERLLQLNCCIYDPNRIYPGQVLRVKP